jgi:general secretion pathway protein K
MILITVLFFIALLVSGVATFLRRATLDGVIARNRDLAFRCEALARGGVRLATALLLQDRLDEGEGFGIEARSDLWAKVGELEIPVADGGRLRLRIEDASARLNLNGLFDEDGTAHADAESFLATFLDKAIQEMPVSDEEKNYDAAELARNLIDYIDEDDVELRGDPEDEYYQRQSPAYRAANRPLLSIEELGLVEGFDRPLVEAIRPYATVYPYTGGGINPNTAPSYVLAALYHGPPGDKRLADEDTVRRILATRDGDEIFCPEEANQPGCVILLDLGVDGVYPPETYTTNVFQVRAEARYGEVRRTIEAVIDRSDATNPLILSWRVR